MSDHRCACPRASSYVCWMVGLALTLGCAGHRLRTNDRPPRVLREILMSDQHADLDVATVQISGEEQEQLESIWSLCDEQVIAVESRRYLRENGFRAGVIGLVLPEQLRQALSSEESAGTLPLPPSPEGATSDIPLRFQRLRVRQGQRHEIVASGTRPELTTFIRHDHGLSGRTFPQAQAILAATLRPAAEGAVLLELIPEIHHGEMKQRYVAGEGAFRLSAARERFIHPEIKLEVPLSPGESLLIGSTGPPGSFGRSFLDDQSTRKLMIIRLSATQHEPLYADSTAKAPEP